MLHSPLTPFFSVCPSSPTSSPSRGPHYPNPPSPRPPSPLTLGLLHGAAPPTHSPCPSAGPTTSHRILPTHVWSTRPNSSRFPPHTENKDKSPSLPHTDGTWASAPNLGALTAFPLSLKQPCLLETSVPKTHQGFSDSRAVALCSLSLNIFSPSICTTDPSGQPELPWSFPVSLSQTSASSAICWALRTSHLILFWSI